MPDLPLRPESGSTHVGPVRGANFSSHDTVKEHVVQDILAVTLEMLCATLEHIQLDIEKDVRPNQKTFENHRQSIEWRVERYAWISLPLIRVCPNDPCRGFYQELHQILAQLKKHLAELPGEGGLELMARLLTSARSDLDELRRRTEDVYEYGQ